MDLNNLLNSVLKSGQDMLSNNQRPSHTGSKNQFDFLKGMGGMGGGIAAAGLLSLLLGGKGGRGGMSQQLAKYGSLATLGTLAYKAYQSWQDNQPDNAAATQIVPTHERSSDHQERDAEIILQTMIAAAAADGRIDAQEQQAILSEVGAADSESKAWIEQQLRSPVTSATIAGKVGNDHALAGEVYLAARLVCGDLDRKEIIFLHELAEALKLDDNYAEHLEKQAGF